jgi:hypothetical protein
MMLAKLVSPWLGIIVNALEDVRVNYASHQARPGIKKMFDAMHYWALISEQTESNGMTWRWDTRPLNHQAMLAIICIASKLKGTEKHLAPEIGVIYADPVMQDLLRDVETLRSASATYYLSFSVLDALRNLGFCLREGEPQPEENDEQSGQPSEPGQAGLEKPDRSGQDQPGQSQSGDAGGSGQDSEPEPTVSNPEAGSDQDSDQASDNEGDSPSESSDEAGSSSAGSPDNEPTGDEPEEDNTGVGEESSDESISDPDGASSSSEGEADSDEGDPDISDNGSHSSKEDVEDSDEEGIDSPDEDDQASQEMSPSSEDPSGDSSDEPVDTGADKGYGGIKADYDKDYGSTDAAEELLRRFFGHEQPGEMTPEMVRDTHANLSEEEEAVDTAVVKGLYFEKPPVNVSSIRIHTRDKHELDDKGIDAAAAFNGGHFRRSSLFTSGSSGVEIDTEIPESVLGPALLKMRTVLADNQRTGMEHNRKSGKIRASVLGKRGFNPDDERLFQKKRIPRKKNYAVLLGIDVSGSTLGRNLALAKRAALAQAELCNRTKVKFSVWAHSAKLNGEWRMRGPHAFTLDMYQIKSWDQPWDTSTKRVLETLASDSDNLDGHSMEFYRKELDKVDATDKILMYYTDGKMPAANADEELEVLQRELRTCKQKGYIVPGVGIRTDSPTQHGLDTVQVDDDADLIKVVHHLEKLMKRR